MIVPVSGFGKGDPGPGIGRNRAKSDVEKMANGNMADGKCAGRVSEAVIEGKAPEKTGALQELRWFGWCIGPSAILGRQWPSGEPENKPSPRPSPIRWARESERGARST